MDQKIEQNARAVRDHYNRFFDLFDRDRAYAEAGWDRRPPIVNLGYWGRGARTSEDAQVAFVHELASRLPMLKGSRVLDAGCGLCGPAAILAADYGAQVDGLNINEQQICWARKFIAGNRLESQVRVHLANAMDVPFPDETFDIVFSLEAAHCFIDKRRFLAEACRVLRPGGTLLLSDITATTRDPFLSWLPALKLRLATAAAWYRMVEASGFAITEKELIGSAVYPGYRQRLNRSARERRLKIFNRICKGGASPPVRLRRSVQAWALELVFCRSVLPIFSWLKLREYVLIIAQKKERD